MKKHLLTVATTAILVLFFTAFFATSAIAVPDVDGKVNGYGEYAIGNYQDFMLDDKKTVVQGELWQSVIDNFLYVGLVMPRSLVDASYGQINGIDNSVDWWETKTKKGEEPEVKPKTHKLDELIGSDKAQFKFYANGGSVLDITFDYYEKNSTGSTSTFKSSMDYNWANNHVAHPEFFNFGDGPGAQIGYSPQTMWKGSHINYDDPSAVAAAYALVDPTIDWVFDVSYEMQIDISIFGEAGYDSTDVYSGHVSPSKRKYDTDPEDGGRIPKVPEPGTILLLGSGLAGLAFYRRKKNKM